MTNDRSPSTADRRERKGTTGGGVSSAVYGLGFIGAAIYFIQHATTLWGGVVGFLEALVWPAVLVYKLLEFLKM